MKRREKKSPVVASPAPARPGQPPVLRGPGADVSTLQRLAGNEAVSRLLTEPSRLDEAPPGSMNSGPLARVAAAGDRPSRNGDGPGSPVVQRQGPAAPPAAASSVALGSFTVSTFSELLVAERFFTNQLGTDARQLGEGDPARSAAEDLIRQAHSVEPTLQSRGDAALDQTAANQAGVWYQAFVDASKNVDLAGRAAARAELERQQQQMSDALDSVQGIPESMADLQRAAFLKKDDAMLEKIQGCVGTSLIVASAILDARSKAGFMLTKLTAEESHLNELIEHYEPMIEAAHKVSASIELLQAAFKVMHPEGTTEVDKQMNQASAALDAAVAVTSLIPGMGLYTVYVAILVGVAKQCFQFIANLVREQSHLLNQLEIMDGHLDAVDWSVEPGGRPAFDFMVTVMHAEGYYALPKSIPEAVDALVTDSEEQFAKGTGEEVPTRGFWFWKHTNPDKIRQWLFGHRQSVWGMLYGSTTPP
ncbi:MAG TPA: hypothetical protein VGO86_03260 [Candidatus Dormibacteraeota bacterium]